jgi:DNA modification methylase
VGAPVAGVVLDPFLGSGTTAMVAKKLGRPYVGIELNPDYVKMAQARLGKVSYQPQLIAAE